MIEDNLVETYLRNAMLSHKQAETVDIHTDHLSILMNVMLVVLLQSDNICIIKTFLRLLHFRLFTTPPRISKWTIQVLRSCNQKDENVEQT